MPDFIRSRYASYTTTGKTWLTLGIVALIVDAAICYKYGITLTFWHAVGFALVAVFFAMLPDAAYSEIENRRIASGIALSLLCIPLGMVAFQSHLGYGAGVRLGDMQQTGVQNTKYEDGRAKVAENKALVEMWTATKNELEAQNAWVASVSADGLKAQVAAATLSIDQEAKRGGCGPKCLERTKEKADLENRIAIAEKVSDLTNRIDAAQRKIDEYRVASEQTDYRSSAVVNQNNVAAQLYLAFTGAAPDQAVDPDSVTQSFTSIFIAGGGSLAFMIMAPVGFFVAGRNRLQHVEEPAPVAAPKPAEAPRAPAAAVLDGGALQPSRNEHTTIHVREENREALELIARLKKLLPPPAQVGAAA